MATNQLIKPRLNPLTWLPIDPQRQDSYASRHIDDFLFKNTIKPEEQQVNFYQPWINDDVIKDQVKSNYGPLSVRLYSCDGKLINQYPYTTKQQDVDNPSFYIRQVEIDLSAIEPGVYYFNRVVGGVEFEITEPIEILEDGAGTLLIEYSNYEKKGGIYFQSPFTPMVRIYGTIDYDETMSVDTDYEDQDYSEEMLRSVPYRIFKLFISDHTGNPPSFNDKIKRIIGCSDVKIDGRYYVKPEDSKWERQEEPLYPMRGWFTLLRERYNSDSIVVENDIQIIGINSVIATVSNKGFGMTEGPEGYEQIITTE